jgi:hypothetical protein
MRDLRSKNNGETTGVYGGKLVWFYYDHGLYYYLDIINTSNKKDRRRSCANGQDLGRRNEMSHKELKTGRFKSEERTI